MSQGFLSDQKTIFGHPSGLFNLFFAEMWERFSYYGMRALLTLYLIKGFMKLEDDNAYRIYGAYTALVYMTPFFGGIIADRILGSRRSVILGGLLMSAGHLMMTVESGLGFYFALGLLIAGNGFFKPNISTMVGSLYPQGSKQRDSGFTIFYIGINLGAAMSPLLCGYIGENYGWHRGFGLATIGMLTGVAVFVAPNVLSQMLLLIACVVTGLSLFGQGLEVPLESVTVAGLSADTLRWVIAGLLVLAGISAFLSLSNPDKPKRHTPISTAVNMLLIGAGALISAYGMLRLYKEDNLLSELFGNPSQNWTMFIDLFVTICLLASAGVACVALMKGGLPMEAGQAPSLEKLKRPTLGFISAEWTVYLCALLSVPIFMLFVSGFTPLDKTATGFSLVQPEMVQQMEDSESVATQIGGVFLREFGSPAGLLLLVALIGALVYIVYQMIPLNRIARDRMKVALILTFFSLVFWAFFEQAGSSLNVFADRNIDRVSQADVVTADQVGTTIELQPTQEQLGYKYQGEVFTIDTLTQLRDANEASDFTIAWDVTEEDVGMGIAARGRETPASTYQAINPAYIMIFGLIFTALWSWMAVRGIEPSTPLKFSLGLAQLGLGYAAFWYGALSHDPRGMVWVGWLFLGYLLHTTGELCLSPVGLSMITKLSARHLVSTMMGMWFLATAMSQLLAGIIAQFTKVDTGGTTPAPIESVGAYGSVFGILAAFSLGSALVCLVLVPFLKRWMHEQVPHEEE